MRNIEDRLKEEYYKVEVPDYMFDTSRVFKRAEKEKNDSKKKIVSIAASIIAALLITIAIIFTMPRFLKEEEVNVEEKSENIINNVVGSIELLSKKTSADSIKSSTIFSIVIKSNEEYCFVDEIPYTKIKAQVLKCYYGKESKDVEIYVPGGVFTVKQLKDNLKDKINDVQKYKEEDLLKVSYHNTIYIPVAEEGKTYITTLNEIDGKYFVNMNAKYGFKEYDPETNIVKDDMGDEQLDIDRYLESINI